MSRFRRFLLTTMAIAISVFQLAYYFLVWSQFSGRRENIVGADFSHLYNAGRLARNGNWTHVYSLDYQIREEARIREDDNVAPDSFLRFNHPPILLPLLALIAVDDISQAYVIWCALIFLVLAANSIIYYRLLRKRNISDIQAAVFSLSLILFYPAFISLLKGQDTAFLLLGATIWMYGLATDKDPLSGIGLGLTVIRPQIAIILAIPFIFNRRRIWNYFIGTAILLTMYCILMIGKIGAQEFVSAILNNATGNATGLNSSAMFNLIGALTRIAPPAYVNIVRVLGWLVFLLAIIILSYFWKTSGRINARHIGMATIVSLFVTPHLHYHDLALLILPMAAISLPANERRKSTSNQGFIFLLPLIASVALLSLDFTESIRFYFVYILEIILCALILAQEKIIRQGESHA